MAEATSPSGPQPEPVDHLPLPTPPPPRPKVKSYLHKFYDSGNPGQAGEHSDDVDVAATAVVVTPETDNSELRRLLTSASGSVGGGQLPGKPHRGCQLRPIVWKALLWVGVNCLIFGALGLAIAFFLPHEPELIEVPGVQGFVRSRSNADWNRSASVLKYVALGVFGLGAVVTAAGLILPSLVWRLFDDDDEAGSATGSIGPGRNRQKQRQQRGANAAAATSGRTVTTLVAAAAASAAPPARPDLDEKPVQPVRCPEEGHVTGGQVKVK